MHYKDPSNEVVKVIKYSYQQGYDIQHARRFVWMCKGTAVSEYTVQMFYDMFKEDEDE